MSIEIKDTWIKAQAAGGCTFAVYICTRDSEEFLAHYEVGDIDPDGQWSGGADELRAQIDRHYSDLPICGDLND